MTTDQGFINFDSDDPNDKVAAFLAELGIDPADVNVVAAEENTPEADAISDVIFMEWFNREFSDANKIACPEHKFAATLSLLFSLKEQQDKRGKVSIIRRAARAAIMTVACQLFNIYGRV